MSRESWEISAGELEGAFILAGWKRIRNDLGKERWVFKDEKGEQFVYFIQQKKGQKKQPTRRAMFNFITGATQGL